MKQFFWYILMSFLPVLTVAQPGVLLSTLRQVHIDQKAFQIHEDTLPILPGSVLLLHLPTRDTLPAGVLKISTYRIEVRDTTQLPEPPFQLLYRVLPYDWPQKTARLDSNSLKQADNGWIGPIRYSSGPERELVDFKQLDYNGSFARGLSFGNRQDLVLNSSFNLQLGGELGDGINIRAAISDENIPLQPEGNTQQLQEFDKVFVELSKNNTSLTAGDYELSSPDSYFMRYFKKLQGATFRNATELGSGTLENKASLAIARGKFARLTLEVTEGNQGPYKLRGAAGERFIIVLSGTERIWLNGELLRRGFEQDYIIDYNLGELTFTNQRLISRESRVILEYEYADQNYLRSLYTLGTTFKGKRSEIAFNWYSQQDSKTNTGLNTLSDEDKRALAAAGDDLSKTVVSSVRPLDAYNPSRASYRQIDTLTDCGVEQILVFSNDETQSLFAASFSFAGSGNGLYRASTDRFANEPVYEYIGRDPVTCRPLGDYAPVIQLAPPEQHQLMNLRHNWQIDENTSWLTEAAFSRKDQNRFSQLDRQDNNGLALFTAFAKQFLLDDREDGWKASTQLSYEFKQANFRELNPYRAPEFLRDWSLADFNGAGSVLPAQEHLIQTSWRLQYGQSGYIDYGFGSFLRDTSYRGFRHRLDFRLRRGSLEFDGGGSLLQAGTSEEEKRFLRPQLLVHKFFPKLGNWKLGVELNGEDNQRRIPVVDTLSLQSYSFFEYQFFLESPVDKKSSVRLRYKSREDLQAAGSSFAPFLSARELGVEGNLNGGRNWRLRGSFTYRQLEKTGTNAYPGTTGDNFLGRINGNVNLLKGVMRSTVDYDLGGGQEPRRSFSYIKVRQGEGQYIWLDSLYNNDGIIQPNEMEIAPFQDIADYVRVTTLSDEFIPTNNVNLNWSVQLNPKAVWFKEKAGFKHLMSRFSSQSSLRISRKTQDAGAVAAWNPFQLNIADSSLIALSSGMRHILFFNRASSRFEVQLGRVDNRRKFVQNTGFESRANGEYFLKSRIRLGESWTGDLQFQRNRRQSDSEFFDNKDYEIAGWEAAPELSWIPSRSLQIKLHYRLEESRNQLEGGGEQTLAHDLGLESSWNQSANTNLRLRFSYVQLKFEGLPNSPVGFALLNGLQPGANLLWNLNLEKQLGKSLRLLLTYEGRKTGTARVVHVGRAQVAAVF